MGRLPRDMQKDLQQDGTGRTERVPLGGFQQKLNVKHIPNGFVGRWINDEGGRIAAAQAAGYTFVEDEEVKAERAGTNVESDARIGRVVGTKASGQPMMAYLMKIPERFYEQDQAAKLRQIDETELSITKGAHARTGEQEYVPQGGISIKRA